MSIKNMSKTKTSFLLLLLHLMYAVLFAGFMLIADLLEAPCNRDGIYLIFSIISIALLCFFPFFTTFTNTASIAYGVMGLQKNESKTKNIIMMATAILYETAVIWFFIRFWQRAMGV